MIVWTIDVLEELKKEGYNTSRLKQEKIFSETVIQDLRSSRGGTLGRCKSITVLNQVCMLLDCSLSDVADFIWTEGESFKRERKKLKAPVESTVEELEELE